MNPIINKLQGYLQIFIGMGAVSGGLPMVMNSTGSAQGLSLEILAGTPFDSYLIPGIILITVNGIGSLVAAYFSLKFKKEAGVLGLIFGFALMVWILVQIILLGLVSWMQPLFGFLGLVEFVLGYIILKKKRIKV